jgi:hypothetical protein
MCKIYRGDKAEIYSHMCIQSVTESVEGTAVCVVQQHSFSEQIASGYCNLKSEYNILCMTG